MELRLHLTEDLEKLKQETGGAAGLVSQQMSSHVRELQQCMCPAPTVRVGGLLLLCRCIPGTPG